MGGATSSTTADSTILTPDRDLIGQTWDALPAGVHEVRIPNPREHNPRRWRGPVSGYYDDREAFINDVAAIDGRHAEAVYVTLNACAPQLLARAHNRLSNKYRLATTADKDMLRLERLLIDCDAGQPAGTSATAEQMAAALALRDVISPFLQNELDWPWPLIVGESGNGGQLIYVIDLPNDPEMKALLERDLKALDALFSQASGPKVDTSTYNPARVSKVFGSISAKGDDLPAYGYPWRLATATFNRHPQAVSLDQLRALADLLPSEPKRPASNGRVPDKDPYPYDLADILRASNIAFTEKAQPYGRIFELAECLTSSEHARGGTIFYQIHGSNAPGYRCLHDHCAGKRWEDVKHLLAFPAEPALIVSGQRGTNGRTDAGSDSAGATGASDAAPYAVYRTMTNVEARSIESLWPGYIVAHKFNLVAGYGGVGKGQLFAHLIARWSKGDAMPYHLLRTDDERRKRRTLILAAEDDPHEDIRPRLDANGANLDNVLILDGVREPGQEMTWVNVARHMPVLLDLVRREHIDIVYLDPLSSYMPGVKRQSGGEVRDTLGHLQRLINETNVTVIGTMHFGKAQDRHGAMRILDSVEFVNAARNVLGVNDLPEANQPDDVLNDAQLGRRKILAVLKSNSAIPGPPLVWSRPRDKAVQWHGESPVSFDETFRAPAPGQRGEDAIAFLKEELKGGSRPSADISAGAKANGISERTLKRAKADLKIVAYKPKHIRDSPWYLQLPGSAEGGQTEEGQADHQKDLASLHNEAAENRDTANPPETREEGQGGHNGPLPLISAATSEGGQVGRIHNLALFKTNTDDLPDGQRRCVECRAPAVGNSAYCVRHGGRLNNAAADADMEDLL